MPNHVCPRCKGTDTVLEYSPTRRAMALFCRCGWTDDPTTRERRIAMGQDPVTGKTR